MISVSLEFLGSSRKFAIYSWPWSRSSRTKLFCFHRMKN